MYKWLIRKQRAKDVCTQFSLKQDIIERLCQPVFSYIGTRHIKFDGGTRRRKWRKETWSIKRRKKLFKKEESESNKRWLNIDDCSFSTEFTKLAADIVCILILIKFYRRAWRKKKKWIIFILQSLPNLFRNTLLYVSKFRKYFLTDNLLQNVRYKLIDWCKEDNHSKRLWIFSWIKKLNVWHKSLSLETRCYSTQHGF